MVRVELFIVLLFSSMVYGVSDDESDTEIKLPLFYYVTKKPDSDRHIINVTESKSYIIDMEQEPFKSLLEKNSCEAYSDTKSTPYWLYRMRHGLVQCLCPHQKVKKD